MAHLAIADPPYYGRASRWYGSGTTGKRKARGNAGAHKGGADFHPDAEQWDDLATHQALITRLENEYDGFVLAMHPENLVHLLPMITVEHRVMVWHKPSSVPSGSRLHNHWEPVVLRMPEGRKGHRYGMPMGDVLTAAPPAQAGFAGAKPSAWTRWVLDCMGWSPDEDTVDDLFGGSNAVGGEVSRLLF